MALNPVLVAEPRQVLSAVDLSLAAPLQAVPLWEVQLQEALLLQEQLPEALPSLRAPLRHYSEKVHS